MRRIDPSDTPHNTGTLHSFDSPYRPHNYEDIMQYRDMNTKPLEQLRKKFHISTSRLYQIWRGQEIPLASKSLNISNDELGVFYEKEDKRGRKFMEEVNRILAT
ncbi:hypothetical protein GLOIN_2v1770749 [Rhizophagus clarus]|uniref:Uncharacterized protein n=1 Tax=Rhizophagus clarus TaxID=94130 RepID=A0A8H3LFR0_9GLOM|nr:hypothetical protein GLOIN_2v1770749 [Rhizophagus clarus]